MKPAAPLILALALAGVAPAHADEAFRCGKWVVSSSMTVSELLAKCGEPAERAQETSDVRARGINGGMVKVGETVTETWTFARGTQAAPMVVTIVDGRIKSIERKPG
ncbi:MAG TPA: DUF2845 domain-containing protein [Steroidobacteraceae bacterium]|nr:DUF2845 domain-containing protein [Steroidobacteraceae bacterium]